MSLLISTASNFSPQRNPTPPGVTMRDGIPHWPPYTEEKKEFMAINRYWNVRNDYSLVCYVIYSQFINEDELIYF